MVIYKKYYLFLILILLTALFSAMIIIKANYKTDSKQNLQSDKSINQGQVRQAAVAGSFYPSSTSELDTKISDFLSKSEKISASGKLRILIVPHAGIEYSGGVAAAGFKQLEGGDYTKVIILGASHRSWFDHAAVYAKGSWETPLGKIAIDEELTSSIIDKEKKILADTVPHGDEHSLEIELIFLQRVLKNFEIVPILVSNPSEQLIDTLAKKISDNFTDDTLLIVSSDLSHYPDWKTANVVDDKTVKSILSGKKDTFEATIKNIENQSYQNLDTAACGFQALRIALKVSENLRLQDLKKIKYQNSGDLPAQAGVAGDKSRVVGYAAIGIWGEKLPISTDQLDKKAQEEALKIARQTLEDYLTKNTIPQITATSEILKKPLGAFVTLRKNGELRGCIGEFEPKDQLYKVIQNTAIAAATKDMRFYPVKTEELKDIKIEISVMTPKRKINNWQDIVLGKHGVVVQKGMHGGTFLPQVATDTGWNKEKFLSELCSQKAGLASGCYKDPDVSFYIFEAQVFEEEK